MQRAGEDAESLRQALCEEIFMAECGGGIEGKHGGAVAVCGSVVFAASNDKVIDVLDIDTAVFGRYLRRWTLEGHSNKVLCLVTVMGRLLFSGSMDHTIRIWDIGTKECIQNLEGHDGAVSCLALGQDDGEGGSFRSSYVCSGSYDATIRIWNWNEPRKQASRPGTSSSQGIRVVRGRRRSSGPASSGEGHDEELARLPSAGAKGWWECFRVLSGHGCYVHTIAAQGMTLYSGGEDGLIKIWNVNTKHSIGQLEGSRCLYCLSLSDNNSTKQEERRPSQAASPSGYSDPFLYSCGIDTSICAWNLKDVGVLEDGLANKEDAVAFELSPKSDLDNLLKEERLLSRKLSSAMTTEGRTWISGLLADIEGKLKVATEDAAMFQFVRDLQIQGGLLYSGGGENVVRIWNLRNRSCAGQIRDVGGGIHRMKADGNLLALSCYDNCVRVYGTSEYQASFYAECLRREQEFQAEGGALMVFSVDNPVTNASRLLPDVCVRNICCGSQHSLILDNSGYVWAWGSSQKGQTGSGDFEFVYKPSRIACNSSRNMNFKSIAAGSSHSVAVAVSGEVWVFGDNSVGQLGIGTIHEKKAILENKFNMQNQLKKLKNHFIELQDEIKTVKKEENNQRLTELQVLLHSAKRQIAELEHSIFQIEKNAKICAPTQNITLKNRNICAASAGAYHTILLAGELTKILAGLASSPKAFCLQMMVLLLVVGLLPMVSWGMRMRCCYRVPRGDFTILYHLKSILFIPTKIYQFYQSKLPQHLLE